MVLNVFTILVKNSSNSSSSSFNSLIWLNVRPRWLLLMCLWVKLDNEEIESVIFSSSSKTFMWNLDVISVDASSKFLTK